MTCDEARERMVDRWVVGIDEARRMELDSHLGGCTECRSEAEGLNPLWQSMGALPSEEPGRHLRTGFHHMLEAYRLGQEQARKPVRRPALDWLSGLWPRHPMMQAAMAGAALVFGVAMGHMYTVRSHDQQTIAQLNGEVQQMRHLVTLSLLQQQSASDRLRGVSWGLQTATNDDEVLSALLTTLNSDSNVNVRLAAVDTLKQLSTKTTVRRGLRDSLARQSSPLVQIALIDWAVESMDRGSVGAMEELGRNAELNSAVKVRLASALERLRERGMQ